MLKVNIYFFKLCIFYILFAHSGNTFFIFLFGEDNL
jgi:hypothetical protein